MAHPACIRAGDLTYGQCLEPAQPLLDLDAAARALREDTPQGFQVEVSTDPGRFLCNVSVSWGQQLPPNWRAMSLPLSKELLTLMMR